MISPEYLKPPHNYRADALRSQQWRSPNGSIRTDLVDLALKPYCLALAHLLLRPTRRKRIAEAWTDGPRALPDRALSTVVNGIKASASAAQAT